MIDSQVVILKQMNELSRQKFSTGTFNLILIFLKCICKTTEVKVEWLRRLVIEHKIPLQRYIKSFIQAHVFLKILI